MNKKDYYEIEAEEVSIFGHLREVCFADNILKHISCSAKNIIDVGCGDGYILHMLLQSKKHTIKHACGLDFSRKRLEKTKHFVPQVQVIEGTIFGLPFPNNSFDTVICSETLEHLENYEQALKELIRITRNELIITVPNEERLSTERCPKCNHHFYVNDHINSFEANKFKKIIEGQSDSIRVKNIVTFQTIYSYNNFTTRWPVFFRVMLDRFLVLLSKKISFFKPNYLLVRIKKMS